RGGGLGNELHLEGIDPRGLVFLGLQRRFRIAPGARATFSASVSLALDGGGLPAGMPDGREPRRPDRPSAAAERRGRECFASVPGFRCSDRYLDRRWWYRWYGLRLNAIAGGTGNYPHPTVCEGI